MRSSPLAWINAEYRKLERSPGALRNFGFTIAGVLLLIALFLVFRERATAWVWGSVALGFFLAAGLAPTWLGPFHRVWLSFSIVLGAIMTPVILTIFFFAIVTPIGLLQRLFGKRSVELGFRTEEESYWRERPSRANEYEKQY
ncbi:MAG: hypothetical protein H0W43_00390 [Chthoniobacterales bacterium]|nr:hypothetical protein [Chthoniobacterales bacterium]